MVILLFSIRFLYSNTPLQKSFPNLFSHTENDMVLVSNIWQDGLLSNLQNRLTLVASFEFDVLLSFLQHFPSGALNDEHFLLHGLLFMTKNA